MTDEGQDIDTSNDDILIQEEEVPIIKEEEELLTDLPLTESEPEFNKKGKKNKIYFIKEVDQEHKETRNVLTEYEYSSVIGIRATQIEQGGKIFTDYTNLHDPISIAKKEFKEKKTPLKLVRKIKDINNQRLIERWDLREMSYFE